MPFCLWVVIRCAHDSKGVWLHLHIATDCRILELLTAYNLGVCLLRRERLKLQQSKITIPSIFIKLKHYLGHHFRDNCLFLFIIEVLATIKMQTHTCKRKRVRRTCKSCVLHQGVIFALWRFTFWKFAPLYAGRTLLNM